MPSFRRSPGAEHLVHAVELPELAHRRPAAGRNGARYVQGASLANGGGPAAGHPGSGHGSNGVHKFRARRAAAESAAPVYELSRARPAGAELRELDVPRPPAGAPRTAPAAAPSAHSAPAPEAGRPDAGRIELLERRLAKLARLLEERDEQLQLRMERATQGQGVASVYSDVQGLRGQSEEAERKRALMSSIFEANRKLRERIGSLGREAE